MTIELTADQAEDIEFWRGLEPKLSIECGPGMGPSASMSVLT